MIVIYYRYLCFDCLICGGAGCVWQAAERQPYTLTRMVWQALVQHVFWSVAGVELPKQFPTKTFKEVAISPPSLNPKP